MNSRTLALSTLLIAPFCAAQPVLAQEGYTPPLADETPGERAPDEGADGATDGLGMIERGMGRLFQDFWTDVEPGLNRLGNDMSGALSRMGPVLKDLSVLVDDLGNYQAPQRLENGDILIARKPGAPPPPPIGDNLQDLTDPDQDESAPDSPPAVPRDPDAPEIEL